MTRCTCKSHYVTYGGHNPEVIWDGPCLSCENDWLAAEEPAHIIAAREAKPLTYESWLCFDCGQEFEEVCPCKEKP
jgi:hypothetical protein